VHRQHVWTSAFATAALLIPALASAVVGASVVSLPTDTVITHGGVASVSASINPADGMEGIDIRVQYDPAVVTATAVTQGPLAASCTAFSNLTTGQVAVSIACTPLSGSGDLFTIDFQAVATGSTDLVFTLCRINEDQIPCVTNNGRVAVVAPTATATPTATPAPPVLNLGSGVGRPGGVACLPATLSYGAPVVTGTTNDLGFDAARFALNGCAINPAIGAGSPASKNLTLTFLGVGSERVGISGANSNAIPPGPSYMCAFQVGAAVPAGSYAVTNVPKATDDAGNDIAGVTGAPGHLYVTSCTGDCDGNGTVSIGEVVKSVNLFLGQPICNASDPSRSCPAADSNLDGSVSIGEVTQCINRFLGGC
jgi:hypothetical protein